MNFFLFSYLEICYVLLKPTAMKKVTLAFFALGIIALFGFNSCKKCTTCEYTYYAGGVPFTYTYPEECGKKSDIDAYEAACKSSASLVGGTCICN
jgi:hypothetical protein